MSVLFISYKRENLQKVQRLVKALRSAGIDVWWDQDIAPDAPWEATIECELGVAKVVIVAWSQAAISSENVKAEARHARNDGKLIQVFMEKCDPPLFFGERQGIDLSDWSGSARDQRFQAVLTAVSAILSGKRPAAGMGYAPKRRPWVKLAAVLVFVSAGLFLVSNLGGARDAVCKLSALQAPCQRAGLITARPETVSVMRSARTELLNRVEGVWGNSARDSAPACTTMLRYALSRRDGEDYITVSMPGYESVGRVVSAEGASIFTRTVSPASQAGTQWELRLEADRLTQYDSVNTPTPLVRCGEANRPLDH